VHYAGVGCAMDTIMDIAKRHGLFVVEDAAQGMMSRHKGRPLGTIGHLGAYSFHETKNVTSGGEGGLLIINDPQFAERAEIIREKGTDRSQFFRGMVDKYSWVGLGSSYLPGELQAAYLWGQLERAEEITNDRLARCARYRAGLQAVADRNLIELPSVPTDSAFNGHMFYLKAKDLLERTALLDHLKADGIMAVFHYVPLHSAPAGCRYGRFHGQDVVTTRDSERLLRLPLFYGLTGLETEEIVGSIESFYRCRSRS
jgi:dTDP-4-amino-4,6-dideoxygalactose transaminase